MITKDNFKEVLIKLGFTDLGDIFTKEFKDLDALLKVDFKKDLLIYPEDKGLIVNARQTCNFSDNENFVVFECVHALLSKGYKPQHIELEQSYGKIKKEDGGGRADIIVKNNNSETLLIIECKTYGSEFSRHWKKTELDGDQLFRYLTNKRETKYLCLYSSDIDSNQVIKLYHLITLIDNQNYLEEIKDEKPLTYAEALSKNKEDIFETWKETYHRDYSTKGIFEVDIPAYEIGKTKYTLKDLNIISSHDIQGKYHEFATILRQHNVSGRENAFDKLVNLFLCKIVDETTNHSSDLKFYWKGIAHDDHFSLIDRLQRLYQDGMQRFLGEDVVYISTDQIEKAFDFFKNDPDATKDTIKKYFKDLKFFNNNDFGFIDVHNKKLFFQNTVILLKIVQMLQDIRLKTDSESSSEENQFLGDMFEGFLDQGVKQSEGQFFTPMPIVKFILKSLPLEAIIAKGEEIPKVIDFACGAGHFLNEYAKEIKPIVEKKKKAKLSDFYENVYGAEKEYRLSKVAKVSAFMYGQDNINIVYTDALSSGKEMDDKNIKDGSFSVLVANPPYSVKGFLETLTETERKKYHLIETIGEKSYPNNNSIETFFIERAKQLVKPGGVVGIIVPSSVLSKGKAKSTSKSTNIYVATREILIKYFDIVAISEFGSGTFGKTGTNTVTLFLRRKKENPAPADHFFNRINAWFNFDKTKDGLFEDEHLLKQYCTHLELEFEDYQTLLKGEPNKTIRESEIFSDYRKEFDKWSEIKNLKKKKSFKELSKEKQQEEIEEKFVNYLISNEKEKLYYFVLACQNPQKVLIIKSPSKTTEIKEFLGYEWSSAKGNEGIKYLGGVELDKMEGEDEDAGNVALEEDDKRVLSNIFNLNNINTPLYDPHDNNHPEKINFLIQLSFKNEEFTIPESLQPFVKRAKLLETIDFREPDFNKTISLTPKKTMVYDTIWPLQKIRSIAEINPSKSELNSLPTNTLVSFVEMASVDEKGFISSTEEKPLKEVKSGSYTYFKNDDIIFAKITPCMENGKCAFAFGLKNGIGMGSSEFHVIRTDQSIVLPKYLFNLLNSQELREIAESHMTGSSGHRRVPDSFYSRLKIPIPPIDIQKSIIAECEKIDISFFKALTTIEESYQKIDAAIQSSMGVGVRTKIGNLFAINTDSFDPTFTPEKEYTYIDIDSVGKGNGQISYSKKIMGRTAPSRARRLAKKGDFLISSVRPNLKGFALIKDSTSDCIFSTGFFILDTLNPKRALNLFGYYHFMYSSELMSQMIDKMPKGQYPSINGDDIKSFTINVPSVAEQQKLVKEINKLENKIFEARKFTELAESNKQRLIKSYLKDDETKSLSIAAEPPEEYKKS